ncbi:MAG: hypothetical protein QGH74_02105, partial [Candidatus Brocadiia bacterium]|nr:hypothetical protein [Candidatus Brocadiia bacterium]
MMNELNNCNPHARRHFTVAMRWMDYWWDEDSGLIYVNSPWLEWLLAHPGFLRLAEKPEFGTLSGPVCWLKGVRRLLPRAAI